MADRELIAQRLRILLSTNILSDHWRETIENAVLLLENDDIVHCRDCIHQGNCQLERSLKGEELRSGDWFCGDAMRR